MNRAMLLALSTLALAPAAHARTAPAGAMGQALAASDRPEADRARDAQRKPADVLAFAEVKPGQRVADLIPGGGYFTRVFSKAVGPRGKVYAVVPAAALASRPTAADAVKAIATEAGYRNVAVVSSTAETLGAAEPIDLAFTAQNWHDVYGKGGAAASLAFDKTVFAALKPGGLYVVIDHVAQAGAADAPNTLHRIDPAIVKAEVLKAGFEFVGESPVLRNPSDDHAKGVFDPSIRGTTDQFLYKFRKPAR